MIGGRGGSDIVPLLLGKLATSAGRRGEESHVQVDRDLDDLSSYVENLICSQRPR